MSLLKRKNNRKTVEAGRTKRTKIYAPAYEANEYNFKTIVDTQPDGNVTHYANYTKLPN